MFVGQILLIGKCKIQHFDKLGGSRTIKTYHELRKKMES